MKKTGKKALSLFLALLIALPMIMFTPLSGYLALNADAAGSSSVTVTPADGLKIAVPETIYLEPGTEAKTAKYYVNNTISEKGDFGQEASATQTQGTVYFYCPGAKDVSVKLDSDTATLTNPIPFDITVSDGYGSHSIPAVVLKNSVAPGTSKTLKWTFTYTIAATDEQKTAVAYTTVYSPCIQSSAGATMACSRAADATACSNSTISVIYGIHGILTDYQSTLLTKTGLTYAVPSVGQKGSDSDINYYSSTAAGFSLNGSVSGAPILDESTNARWGSKSECPFRCADLTASMHYAGCKNKEAHSETGTGGIGYIMVDTSRYTYFNIPNFTLKSYFGTGHCSSNCSAIYIMSDKEWNDSSVTSSTAAAASGNVCDSFNLSTGDEKTQRTANITNVKINNIKAVFVKSDATATSDKEKTATSYTACQIVHVNKKDLRDAVRNAQKLTWSKASDSTVYNNLMKAYQTACSVLGQPDANTTAINSAKAGLDAYIGKTGKVTVTYKSTTGKDIPTVSTEEVAYNYGDTVSYSVSDNISGYSFSSATVNNTVSVDEDTPYVSTNVISSAINIAVLYEPSEYRATFNAGGGEISGEDEVTFTLEDEFTLPSATKDGYTFAGWKITSASQGSWTNGSQYDAGKQFSAVRGNVDFTAQWTKNTYGIGYDNMFIIKNADAVEKTDGVSVNPANNSVSVFFENTSGERTVMSADYMPVSSETKYILTFDMATDNSTMGQVFVFYYNAPDVANAVPHTDNTPAGGYKLIDGVKYNTGEQDVANSGTPSFSSGSHALVFETPADCKYIRLRFDNDSGGTANSTVTVSNIRVIEYSDAAAEATYSKVSQTVSYGDTFKVATATRKGYDFKGWKDKDGNTVTDGTYRYTADKVLYSQWAPKVYNVVLNVNGGKFGDSTASITVKPSYKTADCNVLDSSKIPAKTGYTFAGYFTDAEDGKGVKVYDKDGKAVTGDYWGTVGGKTVWINDGGVSLYARWSPKSYSLTFNPDGGVFEAQESTVNPVFDAVTWNAITSYIPTKTGYTFSGYYTEDGTKVYDKDGNAVVGNAFWKTKNSDKVWYYDGDPVTLIAKWTPITYTVKYDVNYEGGTDPKSQTGVNYDKDNAINAANPTRTGYAFDAWYFGDTKIGKFGDKYKNLASTQDAEATLTAKWTPITYTVKYDPTDGEGSVDPFTATYDTTHNVNDASTISKTGYVFDGWYYENTFKNAVGSTFKNLKDVQDAEVTLYAKWKPITYTVHYDVKGGTGSVEDATATYDVEYNVASISGVTNTGSKFDGWYYDSDCKNPVGLKYINLKDTQDAEITLYAKWSPVTYHIVFSNNAGTGSVDTVDVVYGENCTLPVPTAQQMSKVGYLFDGWCLDADCTQDAGASVKNLSTVQDGEVVLYAKWKPITYTVHFDANGGSGSAPEDKVLKYGETYAIPENSLTKGSDAFSGWMFGETEYKTGLEISNLSSTQGDVVTLTARWISAPYTVTYVANNGTDEKYEAKEAADTPFNVIENPFTYTGYSFAGWKDSAYGKTYSSTGDKFVYPETYEAGTPVTFTAQWNIVKYTLRFDPNEGTMKNNQYEYNIATGIDLTDAKYIPSRTGYTFAGWTVSSAAGNWTSGETIAADKLSVSAGKYGSASLKAVWVKNTYDVKYSNGDAYISAAYTYNYDEEFAVAKKDFFDGTAGAVTGYEFTRWSYKDDNGDTKYITAGSTKASKLTGVDRKTVILTAEWKPTEYKVIFDAKGGTLDGSDYIKYDITEGITLISANKTGYTLTGWKVKSAVGSWTDTSKVYAVNGELDAGMYGEVTLEAQWKAVTYKVIYKSGVEGITKTVVKEYSYDEEFKVLANQFTDYEEKDFANWKGSDENVYRPDQVASKLKSTQDAEFTFTALWIPHNFERIEYVAPKCGVAGYAKYKCSNCLKEKTEDYQPLSHKYVYEQVEPTCIEDGYERTVCIYCNDVIGEEKVIPMDAKYHEYKLVGGEQQISCTLPSTVTYECIFCHDIKTETTVAGQHSYSEWEVITEPTCGEYGVRTCSCSKCGNIKTEFIPKTEHNITEWGTDAFGNKIGYCDSCGQTVMYSGGSGEESSEVCPHCGRVHVNVFSEIACFFIRIINFFKSLFN